MIDDRDFNSQTRGYEKYTITHGDALRVRIRQAEQDIINSKEWLEDLKLELKILENKGIG